MTKKQATENLIKAMIVYAEPPVGMGSEELKQVLKDFFKAYDGGFDPHNTRKIPNFMELYKQTKQNT